MWGIVIMKKIIISEEQYLRLFLNEQTEIPDFTELEKKYENLLYEMQVMKGSALGPKGWNWCKPCSTTVTGTIEGDIEKGVMCVNKDLVYKKKFICDKGYGPRSVVAKEYSTDNFTIGESWNADKKHVYNMTKKLPKYLPPDPVGKVLRSAGKTAKDVVVAAGDWMSDIDNDTIHTTLDVLSIIALVTGAGAPVALALEALNAAIYFAEGDKFGGGISVIFALIPGGIMVRRAFTNKEVLKQVDKITYWAIKEVKSGNKITKEILEDKFIEKFGEKRFKQYKGQITNYFKIIISGTKIIKEKLPRFTMWVSRTQDQWKKFVKDEKLVTEFLEKNGNDLEKAYAAYLKSLPIKWGNYASAILAYFGILEGAKKLVTIPNVQEKIATVGDYVDSIETPFAITLADDAAKGNISSIVKLAGYDWDSTKEIFMSDSKENDNNLLKQAWESGWRPYDKETNKQTINSIPPKEFWTSTFKENRELWDEILNDENSIFNKDLPEITM